MALFSLLALAARRVPSAAAFSTPISFRRVSSVSTHLFAANKEPVPIHLLAGFLGSGKTTTLKHVLENIDNKKVGVIVNDVASVNIDAKLVKNQNEASGIVELQNGCACCSISDELWSSVDSLLEKEQEWDAILIELSGVADPVAVRNTWREAVKQELPVSKAARLANTVTVVDTSTFGTDYLTWDDARARWSAEDCVGNRKVGELLVEQVEAADTILLNKEDLAGAEQVKVVKSMARSLNEKATVLSTSFGKVSVSQILEKAEVKAPDPDHACEDPDCTDTSHSHAHDHACEDPGCSDTSHSHAHDHACEDSDCTDASHSHAHEHAEACQDPGCTDTSHSHSHEHSDACADPDCTDTSHSHTHSHDTSTDALGISNFVYKAVRPFHAQRLSQVLFSWPIPIKEDLLEVAEDVVSSYEKTESPFTGILRSKGFCWIAPSDWDGVLQDSWRANTAMYWSHAGKHMGISVAGPWWATVPDAQRQEFFADNEAELERVLREDFVTYEFGDRRQELVFIGVDVQEEAIRQALDDCLLTEDELNTYREKVAALEGAAAMQA